VVTSSHETDKVPLNSTGFVFGISGNLLNFTRNETSLDITEIMFEITSNPMTRNVHLNVHLI
jgi:hypothetical protein